MGGDVEIAEGELVKGDVVAIGGSVSIAGRVLGDAVAIGGDLHLAPTAHVNGEAGCVGGHLEKEPGADVGGETVQVGFGLPMGKWGKHRAHGDGRGWSPLFKVLQLAVMALVSFLILSFWGDRIRAMADVLPHRPFKLGFAGMDRDEESNSWYSWMRYAENGRWKSQDPWGLTAGDANLMRYVGNDPADAVDPSGLFTFGVGAGVAIATRTDRQSRR
jgi:RHS repeat-associated protein